MQALIYWGEIVAPENPDQRLPTESDSQRIGQEGVQAFSANHPPNWRLTSTDGDADFGLDQQVQVVDSRNKVSGGIFHAQIKASKSGKTSANDSTFAISLPVMTLNYYARISDPVMLVFVDRSSAEFPKDCEVFWLWISEDIQQKLDGKPDFGHLDSGSITFHVPKGNVLNPSFDVLPHLDNFRRRKVAKDGLAHAVDAKKGPGFSTVDVFQGVTTKIQSIGTPLVAALTAPSNSPWLDPPPNSIAAKLLQVHNLLIQNRDIDAQVMLDAIVENIHEANEFELAEYSYLKARVLSLRGKDEQALAEYEIAYQHFADSEKYTVAFFEAKFRKVFSGDNSKQDLEAMLREFSIEAPPKIVALKSRIQGAIGDFQGAAKTLESLEEGDAAVARALIEYVKNDWPATIKVCGSGLEQSSLIAASKTILHMLRARAFYYESMEGCSLPEDSIIPPFGLPEMDFVKLTHAWEEARVTLNILRESNWPANSEHIVDILGTAGPVLNRHEEILTDLRELSRKRPHFRIVHEHLARLAALAKDFSIEWEALDATEKIDGENSAIHFKVHALYSQNRYREVLALAQQGLLSADQYHPLHSGCLAIAALCAHAGLEPNAAQPFVAALESNKDWKGHLAVVEFVSRANSTPLMRDEALDSLIETYQQNSDISCIQDNLFSALDVDKESHARLCLKISIQIKKRRQLAYREVENLAQAHITLADWNGLYQLAEQSIVQYSHMEKIVAIRAIALDRMGHASEAFKILQTLINENSDEDLAIIPYVNLCIRFGLHQQAAEQLETLFQKETQRKAKLTYLQQLFSLRMSFAPNDTRLAELAWRYGQLADKSIEEQEGVFLQLFGIVLTNDLAPDNQSRMREFQARSKSFFQSWPESAIIRGFKLPENADGQQLVDAISRAVGPTSEEKKWYQKVKNKMNAGSLVAPYCWRPRALLRYISDVPHLWHITKQSDRDALELHFNILADSSTVRLNLSSVTTKPPLFDLTTLLVLYDLDIHNFIFSVFDRIAVSVATILSIQQLSSSFLGGYDNVAGIRDFLKANVDRVLQPSGDLGDSEHREQRLDEALNEIKYLAATDDYSLYIDDVAAFLYASNDNEGITRINTLDLLTELERRELLSTYEVSEKRAKLVSWNIGIVVEARYFLGAIPPEVDVKNKLPELVDILLLPSPFRELVDGLWDIRRPYDNKLNHLAEILALVAKSSSVSTELLAAIWKVWLTKVSVGNTPLNEEGHITRAHITAVWTTKGNVSGIKKIWDAYVQLVNLRFGERMDEAKEFEARRQIGEMAAQYSGPRN